ncbi:MAG: nuclear transport factor 2 family protein [Cyclobacteriaceae bacterium]|nr:nuclear transport factor 2 family protein [Cyclobacteriaceae bacterium]
MRAIFLLLLPFIGIAGFSQDAGKDLLAFERSIEQAVVAADISFLEKVYAEDFRFKHGTGLVDSKESWIKDVGRNKGKFVSRKIDSVEVEIHGDIGITNGTLRVTRTDRSYTLQYVRAYRRKGKQWQLFMHRTVHELHN